MMIKGGVDPDGNVFEGFETHGYTTEFQVLNGWNFGVPQKRQRVFIVSVRNDIYEKVKHPLTDAGLESFLADWEKVPK